MNLQKYKKTKIFFLLLLFSLLIHLIISFFFLEFGFQKRFKSFMYVLSTPFKKLSPQERKAVEALREKKRESLKKIFETVKKKKKPEFLGKNEQKKDDSIQAKLSAPTSNFGWVIFDDSYQSPKKLEIPVNKDGDLVIVQPSDSIGIESRDAQDKPKPEQPQRKAVVEPVKKIVPKKEQPKALAEKPKPDKKILDQKKKIAIEEPIAEKLLEDLVEKDASSNKEEIEPEDLQAFDLKKEQESKGGEFEEDEKTAQKDEKRTQLVEQNKEEVREGLLRAILKKGAVRTAKGGSTNALGISKAQAKEAESKINLRKGYIEKIWDDSGIDFIDRDGDPNKRPGPEEEIFNAYYAKFGWSLQATWGYNSYFYRGPRNPGLYRTVLLATIDKSGKLIESAIVESCGDENLDTSALRNLRFASPFPALPACLKKETLSLNFGWKILVE